MESHTQQHDGLRAVFGDDTRVCLVVDTPTERRTAVIDQICSMYADKTELTKVHVRGPYLPRDESGRPGTVATQFTNLKGILLILEDVQICRSELLTIIMNARHNNVYVIILNRPGMHLDSTARTCIDVALVCASSLSKLKSFWGNYASGAYPSYKNFCSVVKQIGYDEYTVVHIPENKLYYLKPDGRMGDIICNVARTSSDEGDNTVIIEMLSKMVDQLVALRDELKKD